MSAKTIALAWIWMLVACAVGGVAWQIYMGGKVVWIIIALFAVTLWAGYTLETN